MPPNDQSPRVQLVDPATGDVVGSVFADGSGNVEIQRADATAFRFVATPSSGTDVVRFQDAETPLTDAAFAVAHPHRFDITALEDTESREVPLLVPDQSTLSVYRWGAFDASDGTAPTGLDVELLDGGDTVQATANTPNSEDAATPQASFQNTSGSQSVFKLRVLNGTGGTLDSPGVGATFGWVLE
jgi:hypothetical protein